MRFLSFSCICLAHTVKSSRIHEIIGGAPETMTFYNNRYAARPQVDFKVVTRN